MINALQIYPRNDPHNASADGAKTEYKEPKASAPTHVNKQN